MMKIFEDKRIVLGVSGSIAIYKSVTLASRLTQAGALVDVLLTEAATNLVSPLTFETVTGRRAYQEENLWQGGDHVLHIKLGEENDVFVIAPATANTIAKLANGIADNFLTVSALASRTRPIIAPAMDGGMYTNPATQKNLAVLREWGMKVLGPAEGRLASGLRGEGRMLEPEEILGHMRLALAEGGPLEGKKVLVTAGGTREAVDPVRVITNRSSGKQGYALAQAALDLGADVHLISAPTALERPVGVRFIRALTAREMEEAVLAALPESEVLVMAAAVADYEPASPIDKKIKKDEYAELSLPLKRTPDILKSVAHYRSRHDVPKVTLGFAAESDHLLENAAKKLEAKGLDLMVANDITSPRGGFDVDTNQVALLWADGRVEELPLMHKREVAERVMDGVVAILEGM